MKFRSLKLCAAGLGIAPLLFTACGGGKTESCTVEEAANGSAVISCPDGKSVTISPKAGNNGENGKNGTDGANGSKGTDGKNGTDGTNGENGTNGEDGADGKDGDDAPETDCTLSELPPNATFIECKDGTHVTVCDANPSTDLRSHCRKANQELVLAAGLSASYFTRNAADWTDQMDFWPYGSTTPTHLVTCNETVAETLSDGRLQPSVQIIDLATREVKTIVRGMTGCDGIRVTPWGTIMATEEFANENGGAYEILWSPSSTKSFSITNRANAGQAATIVDEANADASAFITKRTALAAMAWEGIGILPSGVVYGGDELRPGTAVNDADGGALLKFIPTTLRTGSTAIASLADSPFSAGKNYALQVECTTGTQFGQGCEIGNGKWVEVAAATARAEANSKGATGYYRPEDLHIDPHFAGAGTRLCFANTGDKGVKNYGEVMCLTDSMPTAASGGAVAINRLLEGDSTFNQPDNFAFHPTKPGLVYVIEDNGGNADVWACLDDGADRDIKSDGCLKMLTVADATAEPTGFVFHPDGTKAYLSIQHSADGNMPLVDGYKTDDLIEITGFSSIDAAKVAAFGADTQAALASASAARFGFGTPVATSTSINTLRESTFPGGVAPSVGANGFGTDASGVVTVASGLTPTFLTRIVAENADQGAFWPYGSSSPTHVVFCIEGGAEDIGGGKMNPSVQAIELGTGNVKTILRGMDGCDGIRITPWSTLVATEEANDGGFYEILWSPSDVSEYTIQARGASGVAATIVDETAADASAKVVKRTALPTIAWEGFLVTSAGIVVGGDELRPGTGTADADGGALFKFIPTTLRTASGPIAALGESPFTAGSSFALRVVCDSSKKYGQGCEIGQGQWVSVGSTTARLDADAAGATGYYRPEDLDVDPTFAGTGIRFCFANTGNAGASNYGEVLCAVDSAPNSATSDLTVEVVRFIEGDPQLNQPDNVAFQPGTGILYVIEDNGFGDVWACLPDGTDRDNKSDGCVRMLTIKDTAAEPTGFIFHPADGSAYVSIQHSAEASSVKVDDYKTDDLVKITGFGTVSLTSFGTATDTRLKAGAKDLFGFTAPAP